MLVIVRTEYFDVSTFWHPVSSSTHYSLKTRMSENSKIVKKKKTFPSASVRFSWIFCLELSKFVSHDILIGTKCQVALYEFFFGEMLFPLHFQSGGSASNNSQ